MRAPRTRLAATAAALALVCLAAAAPHASRDAPTLAALQAGLGDLLAREGRFRDAIPPYEQAFAGSEGQRRVEVGQQLVKSLLRSAEFRRAREVAYDVALASPSDPESIALEADTLWAAGLFDEAEASYRRALQVNAQTPRARNGLARSLLSRGDLAQAHAEAHAAILAEPWEADWHHTMGSIFQAERRYGDAARAYARYVSLLPYRQTSETALWAIQQVKFLSAFGNREPMRARRGPANAVHRVPFRLERDKILVSARVNGAREIPFVVDTGAEMTVVTQPIAERHGVRPEVYTLTAGVGALGMRSVLKGRMERFQVGTLDLEHVPTLIKSPPLGAMASEAESFNPIAFGLSVEIDYRNRVLVMTRALDDEGGELERLPMRVHRLALVRGLINRDNPAPFVVDTGGQVISISRSTATALQLRPPRHIPLKVYGVSGIDPDAFLMPGLDLAFDSVHLKNTAVAVLNLDAPSALLGLDLGGIVGHKFLSKYRVAIDLPRAEMRLR